MSLAFQGGRKIWISRRAKIKTGPNLGAGPLDEAAALRSATHILSCIVHGAGVGLHKVQVIVSRVQGVLETFLISPRCTGSVRKRITGERRFGIRH